jgi:hypothetical protein
LVLFALFVEYCSLEALYFLNKIQNQNSDSLFWVAHLNA